MLTRVLLAILAAAAPALCQQATLPDFVSIPAGEFQMGSPNGAAWEKPTHPVSTPTFEISATPVTNRQYQAFRPEHQSAGDEDPDAPVTGVSWLDAQAYCEWLQQQLGTGVVLPTEARWERAARGGLEQKTYPWGDQYPSSDAKPVTRANAFGVYAVSYNVWEWTSDWYAPDYYSKSPKSDPQGPPSGDFRVLRGGGFRSDPASATTFSRGSARPSTSSAYVTFRVMKTGAAPQPQVTQAPPPAPRPTDTASALAPAAPDSGLAVTAVDVQDSNGGLQIRLATTGKVSYRAFALKSPDRLVVDLEGTIQRISKGSGSVAVGKGGVKQIRYSQFQADPPVSRAVIDLDAALNYQVVAADSQLVIRLSPAD